MARAELQQLYQEWFGTRFAFIPRGPHHIHDIYGDVRARFADLCDDSYLCRENCFQGHNQPEWQYVVRKVLQELKRVDGDVSRSPRPRHWVFSEGENLPQASDLVEPSPARVLLQTYRVLRDTALAKRLKVLHHNACQVCGLRIDLADGEAYSEAHHIQPLGDPHNGPDIAQNIVILCPNHHAMCDYGAMSLDIGQLRLDPSHLVDQRYINYHNVVIAKGALPNEAGK